MISSLENITFPCDNIIGITHDGGDMFKSVPQGDAIMIKVSLKLYIKSLEIYVILKLHIFFKKLQLQYASPQFTSMLITVILLVEFIIFFLGFIYI